MSESRVGKEHYDSTEYFEGKGASHLTDLRSAFQRYRIAKVTQIREPRRDDRIVDLGCGWGTFCFALADRVTEVVGVDFSERSIERCRRLQEQSGNVNLRFIEADAGDTGLPSSEYDLVIAADLFEHLYPLDSERVAAEALRVLVPGGQFVTWTPHRGHLLEIMKSHDFILRRDVTHVDYKSMADMKRLLSDAGFAIERAYYAESHVPGLRVAERMLQSVVPFLRRRIAVLGRKPGG